MRARVAVAALVVLASAVLLSQTRINPGQLQPGPVGYLYSDGEAARWAPLDIGVAEALATGLVPRIAGYNQWTGRNDFAMFRVVPSTDGTSCTSADDAGKIWIDNTDPANQVMRVCLTLGGIPQWIAK